VTWIIRKVRGDVLGRNNKSDEKRVKIINFMEKITGHVSNKTITCMSNVNTADGISF